ncbi:hypothetical protein AGMMS49942_29010 [Spirochaetia bacterium]|nr:hypothetical protein AGMMS49942_29010 [Spirochaetia bacterium]
MGKYDRVSHRVGEPKIGEEAALAEFQKILKFYEVGIDDATNADAKKTLEDTFDELVMAFRWGELELEDGEQGFKIIQHLSNGQSITYRELKAADAKVLERFDRQKEAQAASFAILGRLSGIGDDAIRVLKGQDKTNAVGLSILFFMA